MYLRADFDPYDDRQPSSPSQAACNEIDNPGIEFLCHSSHDGNDVTDNEISAVFDHKNGLGLPSYRRCTSQSPPTWARSHASDF